MNHYPHHIGDFAKDTMGLSQGEIGAYRLLMDTAYSTENGIAVDEVYGVTRATNAQERKNADRVVAKYFERRGDRYYQKRIDEEVATYREKSSKASTSARKRWGKAVDKAGCPQETHDHPQCDRISERTAMADATAVLAINQEPENPNTAFPVITTSGASEPVANSAVEVDPQVARRKPGLMNLLRRHRVMGVEEHPLIVDRILASSKDEHIVSGFNEASRSKGGGPFDIGFLETIVSRISKADREASERQRNAADARVTRTQQEIADQRAAAEKAVPRPDHIAIPRRVVA